MTLTREELMDVTKPLIHPANARWAALGEVRLDYVRLRQDRLD